MSDGPDIKTLGTAVLSAHAQLDKANERIKAMEARLEELTGGNSGGDGGDAPSEARVLTPEQYAGMNWEQKHDAIDVMGVDGVKALMRGENVELPDE